MSNSNTPPKPSQQVEQQNAIPPGSNPAPVTPKPTLTLCTESYKPQNTQGLTMCFDSADSVRDSTVRNK